jgi:uncharacterized repeat protein (TIGR01451 family)/fimbrial isopeptide formation D2 family protein
LVLAVAFACAAIGLLAPATAAAAGTPDINLAKSQPAQALIGTQQVVHLTATNPLGQERGYNLSFRDVLPVGVAYAGSATPVEPRVMTNAPGPGETTLIFENVADLSGNSKYDLSFNVEPQPAVFQITKLHEYTDHAEAFVNSEPRFKPGFNAKGEAIGGTYTGNASAQATTELTAVEVVKSEPSPEGEILRGVHEHQTVYTLTVKNNHVGPTGELEVEDLLPAGLEFLGCGTVDNTTDTKTNPGSTEEYAGSGPIDPGHAPAAPECAKHQPYYVGTVLNPPGHPAGVYTQVKWKNLPELAAGQEFQIQYVAAIPILRNAMTWFDGIAPTAESLGQVANLDNNTGPETVDEEALTNYAEVHGRYEGVAVKDTDEMTRTAEDLAIQKSVTPSNIEEGGESIWTLNLEASEYRFVNGVQIDDTLPNGLCPVGKKGYEKPDGSAVEKKAECEAAGGVEPTYEIAGVPGGPQPAEYSSIKYLADGTFEIHWDESSFGALTQLAPSERLTLKFPTKTRTFYQENYENSTPILTGDSWTNQVKTQGDDFARCAPNDPLCTKGQPKIYTEETEGTPDFDVSAASQEAGGVEIDKTVRKNEGLVTENCSGNYVEGTSAPFPLYGPGDEICWTLRVKFAAKLFAGEPVVTDFIPTDQEFVPGSAIKAEAPQAPEGENSLEATFDEAAALKGEPLKWTLGAAVESGTQIFEWRFKTKVKKEPQTRPQEITGNLMKFVYSNTLGETFPLRDRAEVERQEPELALKKGITEVGGKTVVGGPKSGVTVGGGEAVKYQLDVENSGNLDAEEAEVWDVLPGGITCSAVTLPTQSAPQAAECQNGIIKWTGVAVPKGGAATLTYEVTVPSNVAPGHAFINHAGVARYKSQTNTPEKFEYIPAENINPALTESNTKPLLAQAEIKTSAATLAKEATTETNQPGNGAKEATIGEIVDYKVTAKIPANSKLYGTPVLKDVLPTNLALVPETTEAKLDGTALPFEGATLVKLANGAEVQFSGAYPTIPGAEHTLVLSFKARVKNIAANKRGVKISNSASFAFKDVEEGATTTINKSVETPVVEPKLELHKRLLPAGRSETVVPGEVVEYETEVLNAAGASTANEVAITDTVPPGMEIVSTGTGVEVNPTTITWFFEEVVPNTPLHLTYKLKVKEPATAASRFTNVVTGTTQSLPAGLSLEAREASFKEGAYEAAKEGYASNSAATVRLIGATVSKEVAPSKSTIGSELTYTLHMNLPGEIKFFNATMVDQLPKGITFDELIGTPECEAEGASCGVGTELPPNEGSRLRGWYFGNFEAGPPRLLTVKFKGHVNPEAADGELENSLAGSYNESDKGEPTGLPVPGSESPLFDEETAVAKAHTTVAEPELELTKAVSGGAGVAKGLALPGETLEYTLTVKNKGGWEAWDFNVEDNPSANLTGFELGAVEGGSATPTSTSPPAWHVDGPLAAGGEMKFHYKAKLVGSEALETGDKVENLAKVPVYYGLPPTEREPGQFREYGPLEAERELKVELPQLTIEKSFGTPGQEIADVGVGFKWLIVAKNVATDAGAENAMIVDELPAGWSYVAGSATVDGTSVEPAFTPGNPRKLTWLKSNLPAGGKTEILFEAMPEQGATDGTNEATVKAEDGAGGKGSRTGPYEDSDTATAVVVEPEFKVEKTPDGATAIAGTEATYTIKVTNIGTGKASAPIAVKDQLGPEQEFAGPGTLPAGVTFVSVNPPSGLGGQAIEWTIASLEVGASVEIPVPVKVPSEADEGATIKNTAEAVSPQAPPSTPDEGHFVVHRVADLAIEKKANRTNVVGGETFTYTLTAKDLGPSDATGVTVTDEIPAGTTFVKASEPACTFAGGKVTCLAPVLEAGKEVEFEVEVEVESGRLTPIFNTAKVKGNEEDPNPTNDEKTIETSIGGTANLAIEKIGPEKPVLLGNDFTYEIKVENVGPSDAVNATVEDLLPAQVKFLAATTSVGTCDEAPAALLTCDLERMLPHTKATIVVTVEAVEVGGFVNIAVFDSDTSPEPKEGEAQAEIVPAADLTIAKTAPATVEPDGTVTYALHVENHGPSVAHKVKVTDPLPAGVDFVSADEGCAAAGTTVTCEVLGGGELAVGDAADFKVTVHVPFALGGGSLTNTATVAGEEGDPHPEDNSSTVTTTVGPAADLAITKTMGKAQAGQPLTYTLAVTNKGPSDSSAVTVKDTLPAGTTFKSATPSQGACGASGQTVTCGLGPLSSGSSAQVSITVEVAATATGSLRNSATVEGPEPDPDKSNNESSVEGPVTPPVPTDPNLKVVKTADTSTPQVGTPFTYHVEVSNMSGGEAKNVKVVDTLNGPVKVTSIEAESGKCGAAGSTITCTIPSIPVGKTVNITYTVVVEAAGELKNTVSAQAANGEKAPGNNRAVKSVKAKVAKGTFELTKTAARKVVPGGKKVGFTITLRNGAAALTDAKVCDRLPAALVFVKAAGARYVNGEACWTKKFVAARQTVRLHLTARAVKGYSSRQARNVATAEADNASRRSAAATVRVKPAFAGKPGGVTG